MNLFIPVAGGIGSILQGDFVSGYSLLGAELTCWVVGGTLTAIPFITGGDIKVTGKGTATIIACGIGIVACRIAGIVLPCKWAKTNGEIALTDINPNTSLNGTLAFNPIVDTENEKYGLSATIRY